MDSLLPVFIDLPEKSQVSALSKQRCELIDVVFSIHSWQNILLSKPSLYDRHYLSNRCRAFSGWRNVSELEGVLLTFECIL